MYSYAFPGNIEDDILQIGAQQIPYMRTAWFSDLMKENELLLLEAIDCHGGKVLSFTASGTGAMDAVVENYVAAQGKAFVVDGGSFGHRWMLLCEYHGVPCDVMTVPFAKDIDYTVLEQQVAVSRPQVFLCQHHETSSGQLFNLKKISAICQKYNISLVVDVISSFLAEMFSMDDLHIDVAITSTQKGLNLPPGASLVFLSANALKREFLHRNYYFDFQENLNNLTRGQTPFSPATTLFMQINERLKRNQKIGLRQIVENTRRKALYFREQCKAHGWEIPAEVPANAITGFFVHRNGDILFQELQKKDIYLMPSRPNFFRVSHMGIQNEHDLDILVEAIAEIENR